MDGFVFGVVAFGFVVTWVILGIALRSIGTAANEAANASCSALAAQKDAQQAKDDIRGVVIPGIEKLVNQMTPSVNEGTCEGCGGSGKKQNVLEPPLITSIRAELGHLAKAAIGKK